MQQFSGRDHGSGTNNYPGRGESHGRFEGRSPSNKHKPVKKWEVTVSEGCLSEIRIANLKMKGQHGNFPQVPTCSQNFERHQQTQHSVAVLTSATRARACKSSTRKLIGSTASDAVGKLVSMGADVLMLENDTCPIWALDLAFTLMTLFRFFHPSLLNLLSLFHSSALFFLLYLHLLCPISSNLLPYDSPPL